MIRTARPAEPYRKPPAPPSPPAAPRLALRAEELADSLGISVRSIMGLVASSDIPHTTIGRRCLRFPMAAVEKWLAQRTSWPASMSTGEAAIGQGDVLQEGAGDA
jgi:excisionase family DNA binding protein